MLELTVGVLTGWGMVYATGAPREKRLRAGLRDARRIRQGHIELLMMGTILVALGAAVPDPPIVPAVTIAICSWLAPLAFFPLAFRPDWGELRVLRLVDLAAFTGLSLGYVALTVTLFLR